MSTITALTVQNIKRLSAVEINAAGQPVVVISGKNAAGKSSVLDSICMAIGGRRLVPERPIREGEDTASVEVVLSSGLKVKRRFHRTEDGYSSKVEVSSADGASYKRPQSILDELIGSLAWDPLEWTRKKPEEQAAVLRDAVGVSVRDLDAKIQAWTTQRRDVGRDERRAQGFLDTLREEAPPAPHGDLPDLKAAEADLGAVEEAYDEWRVGNQKAHDAARDAEMDVQRAEVEAGRLEALKGSAADAAERVAQLERLLESAQADQDWAQREYECKSAKLESAWSEANERADVARKLVEQYPKAPDIATARDHLAYAQAEHAAASRAAEAVQAHERRVADAEAEVEALREQWEQRSNQIQEVREEKLRRLREANYPIPGLAISEDGHVYYQGQPFEQASQAEQIRVSTALGLALNPDLRVVMIREASLLDQENLKAISEIAEGREAQVWLERVGDDGAATVVIEDGRVA